MGNGTVDQSCGQRLIPKLVDGKYQMQMLSERYELGAGGILRVQCNQLRGRYVTVRVVGPRKVSALIDGP